MNPPDKNKQGWDKIWWDDYDGEPTIVLEEFNGWMGIENFLILTGGHKMRLNIKGGQTYANHNKVIITSNKEPDDWWPQIIDEHWEALIRRITKVRKFNKGGIILEGGTEMLTRDHGGNKGSWGNAADALVAKK